MFRGRASWEGAGCPRHGLGHICASQLERCAAGVLRTFANIGIRECAPAYCAGQSGDHSASVCKPCKLKPRDLPKPGDLPDNIYECVGESVIISGLSQKPPCEPKNGPLLAVRKLVVTGWAIKGHVDGRCRVCDAQACVVRAMLVAKSHHAMKPPV